MGSVLYGAGGQDFARTVGLQRTHDTGILHGLEQPRSPVVADLQAPLHIGNRGLALLRDDLDGIVVQGVLLRVAPGHSALAFALLSGQAWDRRARTGEYFFHVVRRI